jgi:hypothetical protein
MLGCERVELKTDVRNVRSRAAIEAVGAQFEGVFRAPHEDPGRLARHRLVQRDPAGVADPSGRAAKAAPGKASPPIPQHALLPLEGDSTASASGVRQIVLRTSQKRKTAYIRIYWNKSVKVVSIPGEAPVLGRPKSS